jgi:hypothetical protein
MSATTSISVPLAGTNILDMDGNRIISTSMYDTKKPQETVMRVIEKTQPSTTFFAPEAVGTRYELLESVRRAKSHIIYGGPYYKNGLSYNGLMEYSFDGSSYPQSITEKKFLIPFGEYIPLVFTYSGALFLSDENFTKVITRKQRDSGRGLQEKWINGELYVVGLCSDFWSREGIAVAKKSQARKALAFESNSFFRNNRWFLVNLYAWHTYFAKSTGKTLVSVPNDSPIWVINGSW